MSHPNCRIQDVTSHVLFVHLSGLFISVIIQFYIHTLNKTLWLVKEVVVMGVSKYYGHDKYDPPFPTVALQYQTCFPRCPVCMCLT